MGLCRVCRKESLRVSNFLGVCLDCIKGRFDDCREQILKAHAVARSEFDLPPIPPKDGKVKCTLCANECAIPEGNRGFCGLRTVKEGKLVHIIGSNGLLSWYKDPLPTNCVADPFCRGHTKVGYHNLAVFIESCSADCLFCQNWHFRTTKRKSFLRAEELASAVTPTTFCICFFGGDPSTQMPFAMKVARMRRDVAICWETNGLMNPKVCETATKISLETGGCIKFDIKAYNPGLYFALCGVSNKKVFENFKIASKYRRDDYPVVVASTLLVPGYVDAEEVYKIAKFIADINPETPYVLLGFFPHFFMRDLQVTSWKEALEAKDAAENAGLRRIRIGNVHLLA